MHNIIIASKMCEALFLQSIWSNTVSAMLRLQLQDTSVCTIKTSISLNSHKLARTLQKLFYGSHVCGFFVHNICTHSAYHVREHM